MYSPSSPISPSPNYYQNVPKSPSVSQNRDHSLSSELQENSSQTKNIIPKQPRKSIWICTSDKIISNQATRSFRSPINPLLRSTDKTPRPYDIQSSILFNENERHGSQMAKNKCRSSRSSSRVIIGKKNPNSRLSSSNRNEKFEPRKYSCSRRYSSCNSKSRSKSPTFMRGKKPKIIYEIIESSSDCSDSSCCSVCQLEQIEKAKKNEIISRTKKSEPSVEKKLKPSFHLPSLSLPLSKQFKEICEPTTLNSSNVHYEAKEKKKINKEKKHKIKASKDITAAVIHKSRIFDELSSDDSDYQSPKRITLTERFGKMAKWNDRQRNQRSDHRNIRITAGDNYEVEELDIPLLTQKSTQAPSILNGSWDNVRIRYAYYKERGYLEDLTFRDYIKWEEWWYNYQEFLDKERSTLGSALHRTMNYDE